MKKDITKKCLMFCGRDALEGYEYCSTCFDDASTHPMESRIPLGTLFDYLKERRLLHDPKLSFKEWKTLLPIEPHADKMIEYKDLKLVPEDELGKYNKFR